MPLVHHFSLMSWLWKKWIENSYFLSKVNIFKWKSSTKLIADKSRILSASVAIQDYVCYPECLMLWLTDYCLRVPYAHLQLLLPMKHLFPPKDLTNRARWAKAEVMSLLWIYLGIFEHSCQTEEKLETLFLHSVFSDTPKSLLESTCVREEIPQTAGVLHTFWEEWARRKAATSQCLISQWRSLCSLPHC